MINRGAHFILRLGPNSIHNNKAWIWFRRPLGNPLTRLYGSEISSSPRTVFKSEYEVEEEFAVKILKNPYLVR